MEPIELVNIAEQHIAETVALFKTGGWQEDSLFYLQAEIEAAVKGDILGYIRAHFILAMADQRIVGAAAWAPSMCSFGLYELSWATVLPAYRRRGINTLMLYARLRQIRAHHGPSGFTAMVCTWDNPMYTKAGFVPVQPQNQPDKQGKCLLLAQFGQAADGEFAVAL